MLPTRTLRVALSLAVLGITGLSSGLMGVTIASAATPKVVVTPSTNLHNGETVSVAGDGFIPGETVFLVECLRTAKNSNGCNVPTPFPPSETITATGLLPRIKFKVTTGKVGTGKGKCGTTKANLALCAVSVGNVSGSNTGVGNIVFTLPKKS